MSKQIGRNPALFLFATFYYLLASMKDAARERITRMSNIRTTLMETVGPLLGIAIGIVVVVLIAAMTIIGTTNSTALTSATTQIGQFMPLIGLGIGIAAFLTILSKI